MTWHTRRTLAAALATTMALAAIFPVFSGGHWFWRVEGAVLAVVCAGLVTRAVHLPRALQPLVALAFLLGYLALVFAHPTLDYGVVPTQRTVDALRARVQQGNAELNKYGPPLTPGPGVVLLTAAGVGAVALLVDLVAVLLDRVALAGLPLLTLFAVPSAVLPHGLGNVPFAFGACGWLVLLLEEGSERVGRWGAPAAAGSSGARADDASSLGRVGRRIGVAALGLAVLVPALVPGLDHRLVGSNANGSGGHGDGPSHATTYNPLTTLKDQLTLPQPRQLFVYTTDDPVPDYVRMTTLDTFDGNGWSSSKLEADRDAARVQKGVPRPHGEDDGAPHQSLTMRVAIDGDHLEVHWLPVPFGPRKVDVLGTWLWDPTSQTVFSASRTTRGLKPYTVTASRVVPTREALQFAYTTSSDVAARYRTTLPGSPTVLALAKRLRLDASSPYERAVAIQHFFTDSRNGFVYDTQASQPARGQDPLDAFLEGKRGFCEQYATAMAVLLRMEGIPSRVAVGFTPGQPVPGHKGTFSVTTSDAHAWPEAWFPGTGWVRFEPTPAANGATTPDYTLAPTGTPTDHPTPRPTPSTAGQGFPRSFHDPERLLKEPRTGGTPLSVTSGHLVRWAVGLTLALLLLGAPAAATALRRRSRGRRLDPLVAWDQVRDDVRDVGGPWRTADSPRAAVVRLAGLLDAPGRQALERLATAAELVRYAPAGRASSACLTQETTAVRRALHASAPRRVRWRATAFAPSTVQWLAGQLADRVAAALELSDRVLSWVFRPVRRVLRLRA